MEQQFHMAASEIQSPASCNGVQWFTRKKVIIESYILIIYLAFLNLTLKTISKIIYFIIITHFFHYRK